MAATLQTSALGIGFLVVLWTLAGMAWLQSRDRLPVSGSESAYMGLAAGAIVGVANFGPDGALIAVLLGFGGFLAGMTVERL